MSQNNISKAQVENIEPITQLTADNKVVLVQKNEVGDDYDYIKKTAGIVDKPQEGSLDLITSGGVEEYAVPKTYDYESSVVESDQEIYITDFTISGHHNRGGAVDSLSLKTFNRRSEGYEQETLTSFYVIISDGVKTVASKNKNTEVGQFKFLFDDAVFEAGRDLNVWFSETQTTTKPEEDSLKAVKLHAGMKKVYDTSWCTVSFKENETAKRNLIKVNDVCPFFSLSVKGAQSMEHFGEGDIHTTDTERERWNNKISQLSYKETVTGVAGEDLGGYDDQTLRYFEVGRNILKFPTGKENATIIRVSFIKGTNPTDVSHGQLGKGNIKLVVWQYGGEEDKSFVAMSKNSVDVFNTPSGEELVFEFEEFAFKYGYSMRFTFTQENNEKWWEESFYVSLKRYQNTTTDGSTRVVAGSYPVPSSGRGVVIVTGVYYGCGSVVDTEPKENSPAPIASGVAFKHEKKLEDIEAVLTITKTEDDGFVEYDFALGQDAISSNFGISVGAGASSDGGSISIGSDAGSYAVQLAGMDNGHNINVGSCANSIGAFDVAIGYSATVGGMDNTNPKNAIIVNNSVAIGRGAKATVSNATAIGLTADNSTSGTLLLRAAENNTLSKYADFVLDCEGNVKVEKTVGGTTTTETFCAFSMGVLDEYMCENGYTEFCKQKEIHESWMDTASLNQWTIISFCQQVPVLEAGSWVNKIKLHFKSYDATETKLAVFGVGTNSDKFAFSNLTLIGISDSFVSVTGENVISFSKPFIVPETQEMLFLFCKAATAHLLSEPSFNGDITTIKTEKSSSICQTSDLKYVSWNTSVSNMNRLGSSQKFTGYTNKIVYCVVSHKDNSSIHLTVEDRHKLENGVQSTSITSMVSLTQAEYDALTTKDPYTFYIIKEN